MIQDAFVRQRARQLYWQGYPPAEISRLMGINPNTIYAWKKRDQWDETPPVQRVTQSIDARLIQLTEKQNKTGGDFKEIDLLTRQLKKLHDGQPDVMAAGKKGRAKKLKNHFTPEQIAALREKIISRLEWHQRGWFDSLTLCREAGIRNRMILKSRQIGATWYFAQEALLMALRDDVAQPYQRNQIFLSASRRQAFQFKSIIQKAAAEVDVELKGGDKIILSNGAELHFLGTSAASAQSYTGNFYFDEFFWVSRFAELRKVAGAMATLSGLRRTYFSTPSTETHEAYAYWNGDRWNEKKATHKRQRFSVDWKTLHNGLICPDRTWRQIVTLEDVVNHGWKHTDIDEIRDENTEDEFLNLYMCEFVREGESAFTRIELADALRKESSLSAFTFDGPYRLTGHDLLDNMYCADNGRWYETPVDWYGLARAARQTSWHQSALYFKRNVLLGCYIPHPLLSRQDFSALALDWFVFGNAFLELRSNMLGEPLKLRHALAKYMRRGSDLESWWYVQDGKDAFEFRPGKVCHLMNPDINQEIYGMPEYLGALLSASLSHSADMFRKLYYDNGSHAGCIIYIGAAQVNRESMGSLKETLQGARGGGAFKNVLIHAPNGGKEGVQILPFQQITAKDEFMNVKAASRDDVLAAHRVPPQLMGAMPGEKSAFGDVEKAARVYAINELMPVMEAMKHINDWLGEEVIRFNPYALLDTQPTS
ncbi:phage portal protein [Escherichia coli]|nr:phage portal protein [Escherichia coli]MDX5553496.1 phage portal protein [Escherichia coli]